MKTIVTMAALAGTGGAQCEEANMPNRFRTPYAIAFLAIFGLMATPSAAAAGITLRPDKLRTSDIQLVNYTCVHWGYRCGGGGCCTHHGGGFGKKPKCCLEYKYSGGGGGIPPGKPLPIPNRQQ